jgi:uncharacterized protein YjbI with pentapeptide repeats
MSQSTPPLSSDQANRPAKICLDPVDLDFGTVDPNTSHTLQTSVCNCGGQQLRWSTGRCALDLDVHAGVLASGQAHPIQVTLNTGTAGLAPGPNTLLVRFNSSDGSSILLRATVTLREALHRERPIPTWTGFGEKTLWDWSQLLIIPAILLVATLLFGLIQNAISLQMSASQRAQDNMLASEQQREAELKGYLDAMSTLLSNPDLRDLAKGTDLRSLARAQTLTILREMGQDGARKAVVVRFLHDAGLFMRDPFPIVSLADADLSRASLSGAELGGADLAGADLTDADLTDADLSGADMSQARLKGATLSGARLNYTQLTGADLSCLTSNGSQICTNLTGTDLAGADLTAANVHEARFQRTDVSGTNPQQIFTVPLKQGRAFTTAWKVIRKDTHTLLIAYNAGSLLPPYGQLDLTTSELQLTSGPLGNWGTAVVLFPALWSKTSCPTDYCETAPVTGIAGDQNLLDPRSFSLSVSGSIAGIAIRAHLTFHQPADMAIVVAIDVQASSPVPVVLDQKTTSGVTLLSEAFKPVVLRAMHDTSDQWNAQAAIFGEQLPSPLPLNGRTIPTNVTTFGLTGGTSSVVTNAADVTVTINDLQVAVTLEVKPGSDPQVDNVSMWAGVDHLPGAWDYQVRAAMSARSFSAQALQERYRQILSLAPVFADPLSGPLADHQWDENVDCRFGSGGYQVESGAQQILIPPDGDIFYTTCIAHTASFSDFVYQIQMTFLQGGCAGMILRADLGKNVYDIFEICTDGHYAYLYPQPSPESGLDFVTAATGVTPALHTGLGQRNTVTAIVMGSSIGFLLNQQYVLGVRDQSGSSQGQIGMIAFHTSSPETTSVVYSHAQIWNL